MQIPNIDYILVGVVFAFDAETGDVLHMHEKLVQTIDGKPAYPLEITQEECEEIRIEATRTFPRRKIDAIIASSEMAQRQDVRYHIDPVTKEIRVEPFLVPPFAERFSSL